MTRHRGAFLSQVATELARSGPAYAPKGQPAWRPAERSEVRPQVSHRSVTLDRGRPRYGLVLGSGVIVTLLVAVAFSRLPGWWEPETPASNPSAPASEVLMAYLSSTHVPLNQQTIAMQGRLRRPLPSGATIWIATRKYNPAETRSLNGSSIGVDSRGPCNVFGTRWDCGDVNLGGPEEPGQFLVYVLLADPNAARELVAILRAQAMEYDYRHRAPTSGLTALAPIEVVRTE